MLFIVLLIIIIIVLQCLLYLIINSHFIDGLLTVSLLVHNANPIGHSPFACFWAGDDRLSDGSLGGAFHD